MSTDAETGDLDQNQDEEQPKLTLEVKIDKPSACERHVTVTVSRDDIDRYFEDAFGELRPKAEVPGFRPGRAPRKLVETRFRDQLSDQVKGSLLMDAMSQVGEDHEFSAISEPDLKFDAISIPEEGPLTFEFDVEVRPEFDVPQWQGLKLQRPVREYSEDDVTNHLNRLLARYSDLTDRSEGAEPGDMVTATITSSHDGKQLARIESAEFRVAPKLSFRDGNVEDAEKLFSGVKPGQNIETTVKMGESVEDESLQGADVKLTFRIERVQFMKPPALTPQFLDSIGGFDDEEDLREAVAQELERQLQYHQHQKIRQQITGLLTQSAEWDLPPGLVRRQARRELERSVMELRSAGFPNDVIQAHANQLRQNSLQTTDKALKEHFILERIAEEEQIEAEPSDYDLEIELIAEQRGVSPRRIRAQMEKRGQMDALRNQIIERRVINLICEHGEFEEVPLEAPADDTSALDYSIGGDKDEADIPEAEQGGEAEPLRQPVDRT